MINLDVEVMIREVDCVEDAVRSIQEGCTNLGMELSRTVFDCILSGFVEADLAADLIRELAARGESTEELLGAILSIRARSCQIDCGLEGVIDVGGTGGDAGRTFNISTTAALIAAAAGCTVCKHGSRAITGKCGSIDVVEALGLQIAKDAQHARLYLLRDGITFVESKTILNYPPTVIAARQRVKSQTIFNLIGPWCNPCRLSGQIIGVCHRRHLEMFLEVAKLIGPTRTLVVYGTEGAIDELSLAGCSEVAEVVNGAARRYCMHPEQVGLRRCSISRLKGNSRKKNAAIIRSIADESGCRAMRDAGVYTAGAAIWVANRAPSIRAGVELAITALRGRCMQRLLQRAAHRAIAGD